LEPFDNAGRLSGTGDLVVGELGQLTAKADDFRSDDALHGVDSLEVDPQAAHVHPCVEQPD
jgi:hypothetical protein